MKYAFVVHHTIERSTYEDSKLIGVYSSQTKAEEAVARLSRQPGFKEALKGFSVDRYLIDEDNWTEGFGIDSKE